MQARAESREGPEAERRADVHEVEDREGRAEARHGEERQLALHLDVRPHCEAAVDRQGAPEPGEAPHLKIETIPN